MDETSVTDPLPNPAPGPAARTDPDHHARLAEGVHCATALLHWLNEEREALVSRDLPALHLAVEEKRRLVERLEGLDGDQHRLVRTESDAGDQAGRVLRQRLGQLIAECHVQNRINGTIILRSRQSIAEMTRLLTGEPAGMTYGTDGTARLRGHAGTLVQA